MYNCNLEVLATPAKDLNILTYNDYYIRLAILANTMFKWEGLPNDIPERFVEKILFSHGMCAFFDDPELGFMVTKCTPSSELNCYDEPIRYACDAINYHREYDADKCVIIRNNTFNVPTSLTIRLFAARLAEVERTIDVNVKGQKTPLIITCDEKKRLTLVNLMKKYDGNEPFIFGTTALNQDDVKAIQTDVPFIADQLMIYKHDLWNDAMSFMGIANANTDKKERLVEDEVNANNNLVVLSAETMLKTRQLACEEINKKFGTNISVELRVPVDTFAYVAPGMESNVDSKFSNSYIYTGKEGEGANG